MARKRTLICFTLALSMLLSGIAFAFGVSAYNAEEYKSKSYEISKNAYYREFSVTGDNGHTEKASMLTFSPKDYIPMSFACYAGTSGTVETHYNHAVNKYGYEVVAAVNGSYFEMATGWLLGMVISNGKIACAHSGFTGDVVAFMSDGSMKAVTSSISYTLMLDGTEVPNGIYAINKNSGSKNAGDWKDSFYYFDKSCGSVCDTYGICPGYEVICQKEMNSEITVGGTLHGKVIEIKSNSYGSKLCENVYDESDKFVLFVKNGSPYAEYAKKLYIGASVEISTAETVASSAETMEKASSVITNVGWLVKDGVDLTQTQTQIGGHNVTLNARSTAFGVKADGSYVFLTTDGGATGASDGRSLTLRDVARTMIDAGCVNVIRMDGGGSTAFYAKNDGSGNPGYKMVYRSGSFVRSVPDCILIVKRPKPTDDEAKTLDGLIAQAEEALAESEDGLVKAAYEDAIEVKNSEYSTNGDFARVIGKLNGVFNGSAVLIDAINRAKTIVCTDYSVQELENVWTCYENAVKIKNSKNSTPTQIIEAAEALNSAVRVTANVALGRSYTATGIYPNASSADYPDENGVTLTDGKGISAATGGDPAWVGFNSSSNELGSAKKSVISVDLGESQLIDSMRIYVLNQVSWGISVPKETEFEYSFDGETWISLGKGSIPSNPDSPSVETVSLKLSKPVEARFVRSLTTHSTAWAFVSEFEVNKVRKTITEAGFVNGFNSGIQSGDTHIFTPEKTPVLNPSANVRWAHTLYLVWDEDKAGYKVTEVKTPDGKDGRRLNDNEIALVVHDSEAAPADASTANKKYVSSAKEGDFIEFHGINIDEKDIMPGGYFVIASSKDFDYTHSGRDGYEPSVKDSEESSEEMSEAASEEASEYVSEEPSAEISAEESVEQPVESSKDTSENEKTDEDGSNISLIVVFIGAFTCIGTAVGVSVRKKKTK